MKNLPFILLALASLMLASCNGVTVGGAAAYYGITHTRPDEGPPADTEDQTAPHESWCYETAGYAECYDHPVLHADNRLINVDPQNRYPLNHAAYDALATQENPK